MRSTMVISCVLEIAVVVVCVTVVRAGMPAVIFKRIIVAAVEEVKEAGD